MTAEPILRKSDRTRRAILEAARAQFAARGFDGANLRAIAAEASIDPSMVLRYFGSKEGLFAAAVDINLALPDLRDVPRERHGLVLARHLVRRYEGDLSDNVLVMLLRSAVSNEKLADQIRHIFWSQIIGVLEPVVEQPGEVVRRASLVASQTLGVAITRYVLRLPGISEQPAELLIADVAPTLQRYIHGPLGQPPPN